MHPDVATWRASTADDIDAIHALFVAADGVDHPTWTTPRDDIAHTYELSHVDPGRDTRVALAADGSVLAVGSVMRHPSMDEHIHVNLQGTVRPDVRGRGIGSMLFEWQQHRCDEQLAEARSTDAGAALPAEVHVYAGENDLALARIAERHGYRTERWFSTMHRDLTQPISQPVIPDGIALVPFSADRADDARLARNDAFRDHWGSLPSPPERWEKFIGGRLLRHDLSTLAVDTTDDDRIVAFCLASVDEDDWTVLGPNSYIDLVGVVRSHRRRGLAPATIARSLTAMRDAGLGTAVLDVDTESPTGANALYGGLGFVAYERDRVLVRRS